MKEGHFCSAQNPSASNLACDQSKATQMSFKEFIAGLAHTSSSGKTSASSETSNPDPLRSFSTMNNNNNIGHQSNPIKMKRTPKSQRFDHNQQNLLRFISPAKPVSSTANLNSETNIQPPSVDDITIDECDNDLTLIPISPSILMSPLKDPYTRFILSVSKCVCVESYKLQVQSEHANFPVNECYEQLKFNQGGSNCSNLLWTDKYAPTTLCAALYNGVGLLQLQQLLMRWKRYSNSNLSAKQEDCAAAKDQSVNNKLSKRRRILPVANDSSDDDFTKNTRSAGKHRQNVSSESQITSSDQAFLSKHHPTPIRLTGNSSELECVSDTHSSTPDNSDNSSSDGDDESIKPKSSRTDWRTSASVLLGPTGCGKTALVYALAHDLGYKVFELSPSCRRSGKDILDQFQVALDSHQVAKENLSSSFSTFHMTHLANAATKNKRPRRSVTNFFKPIPTKGTGHSKKKAVRPHNDSKGLNLQCNSLLLVDDADVLFSSDRGFWSALCNLLQLARRPIVLTGTDETMFQNLPVPIRIYRVQAPSSALVIPYLRLMCLAEGYQLDLNSTKQIYRYSCSDPCDTMQKRTSPCDSDLDLRHVINQTQSLIVANGSIPMISSFIRSELDLLGYLFNMCPTMSTTCLSNSNGEENKQHTTTTLSSIGNTTNPNSLSAVFDDESDRQSTTNDSQISIDLTGTNMESCDDLCTTYHAPTFAKLVEASQQKCWLDAYTTSLTRSTIRHYLNYVDVDSANLIEATSAVNAIMTTSTAPPNSYIFPDSAHSTTWSSPFASMHHNRFYQTNKQSGLHSYNTEKIELSHKANTDVLIEKIYSDLDSCGGSGRYLNRMAVANNRALIFDYLPFLKVIASGESIRQIVAAKRRFFHYFNRINLYLRPSTCAAIAQSFAFRSPSPN